MSAFEFSYRVKSYVGCAALTTGLTVADFTNWRTGLTAGVALGLTLASGLEGAREIANRGRDDTPSRPASAVGKGPAPGERLNQ